MAGAFASEKDLCASFIAAATSRNIWKAYCETAGFDILLVHSATGVQIGIQAKLALNVKVLEQILPSYAWEMAEQGPDYRAVLVPREKCQLGLSKIANQIGITVILHSPKDYQYSADFFPRLPESQWSEKDWHEWYPVRRCPLPDYVPDVIAGDKAPLQLTSWKIAAIRLSIILDERPVSRADFKHLQMSPTRWTDRYHGWLEATPQGYVRRSSCPDFRAQHPVNYAEIAADRERWWPRHAHQPMPIQGADLFQRADSSGGQHE